MYQGWQGALSSRYRSELIVFETLATINEENRDLPWECSCAKNKQPRVHVVRGKSLYNGSTVWLLWKCYLKAKCWIFTYTCIRPFVKGCLWLQCDQILRILNESLSNGWGFIQCLANFWTCFGKSIMNIGQIWAVVSSQIMKNNTAIWSHWL